MGISPVAGGRRRRLRPYLAVAAAVVLGAGAAAGATAASASTAAAKVSFAGYHVPAKVSAALYHSKTATPIKHVVVIFDENVSFDHYFGTYPYAANTGDGTPFTAKPGTPTVNGLYSKITKKSGPIGPLLTDNPNEYNPQRLTHSEALTSDQNHGYTRGAAGRGQREDGHVRPGDPVHDSDQRLRRRVLPARHRHGLLRRQHRDRPVELRPVLLDERQRLGHQLRPVHPRRHQRDLG